MRPPAASVDPVAVEDLKTLAAKIENSKERKQLLSQIRALIALQNQMPLSRSGEVLQHATDGINFKNTGRNLPGTIILLPIHSGSAGTGELASKKHTRSR